MQYKDELHACAICQSVGMLAMTWDNVPLCDKHWQEREGMQLGSDELFRHRMIMRSFTVRSPQLAKDASGA